MIVSCDECGISFTKRNTDIKRTNHNFCSKSCSAKYTNRIMPKRQPQGKCLDCGTPISVSRQRCPSCREIYLLHLPQTLEAIQYIRHHKSSAWALVRSRARTLYKHHKECMHCGYNKHVEICHIKSISDFPIDALVSEVNRPDNIVILCPNCHWEFDHGLLPLEAIKTPRTGLEPA